MGVIRRLDPRGSHWADTLPLRYPADYLDQLAVREADGYVWADLIAWRDTATKPANYQAHMQALRDAQDKVFALAQEVKF